ncbi:uncharacterized protein B0H18DRAFT_959355 [Fomitopsis serialis]|uniref:uncharacterized protein n=1 Tax=Fomitopsis serialis TaxID=139415 RepID=UPI0020089FA1|nr:uncharacterized protein B0H18DRAFT_959355 [Neoantrodia serialis]KAH9915368.1 hypothetical protein B0H18DRAFT_959355 [Neoantrodia serialis]
MFCKEASWPVLPTSRPFLPTSRPFFAEHRLFLPAGEVEASAGQSKALAGEEKLRPMKDNLANFMASKAKTWVHYPGQKPGWPVASGALLLTVDLDYCGRRRLYRLQRSKCTPAVPLTARFSTEWALSIPLVGVLDWLQTKGTIPGPSQQPALAQVFPYFNPYQLPRDPDEWTSFDQYKPTMQSFLPVRIEDAFPIKFNPRWITAPPILKVSGIDVTMALFDCANGEFAMDTMCLMKHKFIKYKWLWPVGVPELRKVMDAEWSILWMPDVRPLLGAPGCLVHWALDGTLVGGANKQNTMEADVEDKKDEDIALDKDVELDRELGWW